MALTTVANVREMLPDANADSDRLTILINSYSTAIKKYCAREFESGGTATRKFRYEGNGFLDLAPYDLRSITSVTAYTDLPTSEQVTLAAASSTTEADYRLMPLNATDEGTYLWMLLPQLDVKFSSTTGYQPSELKGVQVSVAGTWGMATVPADVELACIVAVVNAYRNPGSFQSVSVGGYSLTEVPDVSIDGSRSLPVDARNLLAPYRRSSFR